MDQNGLGHIILFSSFQKSHYSLNRRVHVMMAAITGIGLLVDTPSFNAGLGKHETEGVAVCVSSLTDTGHPGHMTAHTAAKGVNAVSRAILFGCMATFTQPVLKQPSLGANGQNQIGGTHVGGDTGLAAVHTVAGGTGHPHLGVLALFPVQILLIAVFGFSAGPEIFGIIFVSWIYFVEI